MANLTKERHFSKVQDYPSQKIRLGLFLSENQLVMEMIGSSMEPYYVSGTKVKCEEVAVDNWPYIHGGVYAVKYLNCLVVKRIKRTPRKGKLQLHSDNPAPGENLYLPLRDISNIWKVLRIVDAPAI